jgi:hypothetical protein
VSVLYPAVRHRLPVVGYVIRVSPESGTGLNRNQDTVSGKAGNYGIAILIVFYYFAS